MTIEKGFYEISPLIHEGIAVWPGDQKMERRVSSDMKNGDHMSLSSITATVHLGAHADAPSHYTSKGVSIAERDPLLYCGDCQVIHVKIPRGERLTPHHLAGHVIQSPRILFCTGSFPDPDHFNEDFNSLSPELIHWLAERDVGLVGIDTPSVDPFASKALESHQALASTDMAVLEGLVLSQVPDGHYRLIALPLRIQGADASPVRAILLPKKPATESITEFY